MTFRCTAIDTDVAEHFRRTGLDQNRNRIRALPVDDPRGYPCRHCLEYGRVGESMLLGSFNLPRPRGIYGSASPIFVHAEACRRFDASNVIAPILSGNSLVSVRAYNAEDQCLYDLGRVCDGTDIEQPLEQALDDARTAFINVHTARPGCLLARIDRLGGPRKSDMNHG